MPGVRDPRENVFQDTDILFHHQYDRVAAKHYTGVLLGVKVPATFLPTSQRVNHEFFTGYPSNSDCATRIESALQADP